MAIYLDANALPAEGQVSSLGFSVIRAVAMASGHEILVPELVMEEAVARRRREIEGSVREIDQIVEKWRRMGIVAHAPEIGSPTELAEVWRNQLLGSVRMVPTPPESAAAAIQREIHRTPPTRDGRGARDAVIWLTIAAQHRAQPEQSYFVTQNVKDFADSQDRTRLHPLLAAEIADVSTPLIFCNSAAELLGRLGTHTQEELSTSTLATSAVARAAVIAFSSQASLLSRLMVESPSTALFVAGAVDATPISVNASDGYRAGALDVMVAWTRWHLRFTLGVMSSYGNRSFAQELRPIRLEGDFQLWLRRSAGEQAWAEAEIGAAGTMSFEWE